MNGKLMMMLAIVFTMLVYGSELFSQESVESLRGLKAIDETSTAPEAKPWKTDSKSLARDFSQQPPLIPHAIEGFQVNLKFNQCVACHNPENSGASGATRISLTHFKDRDGLDTAGVSSSRYFCTQCHVAQRDAEPLVESGFEPVKAMP
jgi:cytochrome c-type protein NapB